MPDILTVPQLMALCGLGAGLVMGLAARGGRFCTFGAIEDAMLGGSFQRARMWALAIAVALAGAQGLALAGIIPLSGAIYLVPAFGWVGAILGGILFGLGMACVGTCGFGAVVRAGGGDLKAVIVVIVLGLSAYMAARGLTGMARVALIEPLAADLSALGGQGLHHLVGLGEGTGGHVLGLALALALGGWCLKDPGFRASRREVAGGIAIGLAVTWGWFATGYLGADDFDPAQLESLTYVLPPGEAVIWLVTFSGATVDFGIGAVGGTLVGSFFAAKSFRQFRWDAFDDHREMRRHMLGAFLMGTGGVLALGCTIGQGVTGMSTLSLSAPLALAGIVAGAWTGLNILMEGSIRDGLREAVHFRR